MNAYDIRNNLKNEEIDYLQLKSFLSEYSNPRDKISRMIRSKDIIRVKKGLYVFGQHIARTPWSLESLANLVYGTPAFASHTIFCTGV